VKRVKIHAQHVTLLHVSAPGRHFQRSQKHKFVQFPTQNAWHSSSSGATTSLFESFGLRNYFLPFSAILHAVLPVIYFHNSYTIFIVSPSNIGLPAHIFDICFRSCEFPTR
jgi:hypothetical protein